MLRRPPLLLVLPLLASLATGPAAGEQQPDLTAILVAESARASTPEQLALLRSAASTGTPVIQRAAIRALGRLERPGLVPDLVMLLNVADPGARAEAANAVAQAAGKDLAGGEAARRALLERLARESNDDARAAICEALGRLPPGGSSERAAAERVLVNETARVALKSGVSIGPASPLIGLRIGWGKSRAISTPAALGALRGLEWLLRTGRKTTPSAETVAQLRELTRVAVAPARRLSLLALNAAGAAEEETIDAALKDEDVEVRRLAAAAPGVSEANLSRALADRSPAVRYEALRAWGRRVQPQQGCRPILAAARDANPHVALLALDLLANGCKAGEPAVDALKAAAADSVVAAVPGRVGADQQWHRRSHAVLALAQVAPEAARPLLPGLAAADFWVARMYAARAAAPLKDVEALYRLADDRDANVREAAIQALSSVVGHDADAVYLRALEASDNQLLMTAARALEGTPNRDVAAEALLSALERLTGAGSDSTRDARLALLARATELGPRQAVTRLMPLLRDFDPRVAERAAAFLSAWTGHAHAASPQLRQPQAVPTSAELAQLSRSIVRVTMKGGGQFEISLMTDLAPLSCAAFVRLVSSGYYDQLTIHRVVPNFVIQGGSPGANEYAGASRFMLDEVGRVTQSRGTVGTSTRGRDTGDGQFYVNLVDNPRLDHDYTIFGQVARGMEVVDGILEGDTIERAEVIAPRR